MAEINIRWVSIDHSTLGLFLQDLKTKLPQTNRGRKKQKGNSKKVRENSPKFENQWPSTQCLISSEAEHCRRVVKSQTYIKEFRKKVPSKG